MVFYPPTKDPKDEERKSRIAILSRSPSALFFPPVVVRARITYQRTRHFFSRKIHLDVEFKPRIDSAGHLSYQTEINFAIKRGSKVKITSEVPLDTMGRVRVLSTPYANLCLTNASSRKTVIVEHDGESMPWRLYWDRYDPHNIRLAPLGE